MGRIVVLISGSGSNLQALMDATRDGRIPGKIVRVISNRPGAYGLERAAAADIPCQIHPYGPYKEQAGGRSAYDEALAGLVDDAQPDLIVLAGWMRILSPAFVNHFSDRLINLHPALPGAYPGKDAIKRAWEDARQGGQQATGVMIHRVVEEVDAGSVLGVREVQIEPGESLSSLEDKMHAAEHELIVAVVSQLLASK